MSHNVPVCWRTVHPDAGQNNDTKTNNTLGETITIRIKQKTSTMFKEQSSKFNTRTFMGVVWVVARDYKV